MIHLAMIFNLMVSMGYFTKYCWQSNYIFFIKHIQKINIEHFLCRFFLRSSLMCWQHPRSHDSKNYGIHNKKTVWFCDFRTQTNELYPLLCFM